MPSLTAYNPNVHKPSQNGKQYFPRMYTDFGFVPDRSKPKKEKRQIPGIEDLHSPYDQWLKRDNLRRQKQRLEEEQKTLQDALYVMNQRAKSYTAYKEWKVEKDAQLREKHYEKKRALRKQRKQDLLLVQQADEENRKAQTKWMQQDQKINQERKAAQSAARKQKRDALRAEREQKERQKEESYKRWIAAKKEQQRVAVPDSTKTVAKKQVKPQNIDKKSQKTSITTKATVSSTPASVKSATTTRSNNSSATATDPNMATGSGSSSKKSRVQIVLVDDESSDTSIVPLKQEAKEPVVVEPEEEEWSYSRHATPQPKVAKVNKPITKKTTVSFESDDDEDDGGWSYSRNKATSVKSTSATIKPVETSKKPDEAAEDSEDFDF